MSQTQQRQAQPQQRKAYTRPQLVKHGNVESLTQGTPNDLSCPIKLN